MDPLTAFEEAAAAVRAVWSGGAPDAQPIVAVERARLVAIAEALGSVSRHLEGLRAQVAAEIARESRPELGADALAKKHGFRNAVTLIASVTGTHGGSAARLIEVGAAISPGTTLTGAPTPARHPHVADAVHAERISADAAVAIIRMLDRVALRAQPDDRDRAERTLADQASGLTLDQLGKLLTRAEAHLDPDGLEPLEADARAARSLRVRQVDGRVRITGELDAETAAPVITALEAIVAAGYHAASSGPLGPDERSHPQRQADALATLCAHFLSCAHHDVPGRGATVIVRMTLEELMTGRGSALVDGLDQPVSAATARRMASAGGVIPAVLGGDSEILDWGREKRLFTKAQRRALTERDGGCVGCDAPPGTCKVHHIEWWSRHRGRTDLDNGVLLCESCHHRIHDNGWDIRIDGAGTAARVWLIPPPHIDPSRTPRAATRHRYVIAA